jgi:malonate transporter
MLRLPFRDPVIAASAAGLLVAATGLNLPDEVVPPVRLLGGAGVPSALFARGMSLHARSRPTPAAVRDRAATVLPGQGLGARGWTWAPPLHR